MKRNDMKLLFKEIITHYENAIKHIDSLVNIDAVKDYLYDNNLDKGICKFSFNTLKSSIYHHKIIENITKKLDRHIHWVIVPSMCESIDEVKTSMLLRITIMKAYVNNKSIIKAKNMFINNHR